MHRLLHYVLRVFDQIRQDSLRRYIYLFLLPWFVPIVAYLIFGDALLAGPGSFVQGVGVVLGLSVLANQVDTYLLRRIIRRYPSANQSAGRIGGMALTFTLVNLSLAALSLYAFQATGFLNYHHQADTDLWVFGFVFISSIVAAGLIESAYAFTQWQRNEFDKHALEQDNLRIQLDGLKTRINPHFLFNSLNAVSALITDEPAQAEAFVDELSKVYRYLLQANKNPLVPLEAEVQFVRSYVRLLTARYGAALHVDLCIRPGPVATWLPPQSLQLLIDDIIRHHTLLAGKPLQISIETKGDNKLCIRHNRQPRQRLFDTRLPDFANVVQQFVAVGGEVPRRYETTQTIIIWLTLLVGHEPVSASSGTKTRS